MARLSEMLSMSNLANTVRERGLVHQFSSETLEEITNGKKRTVYLGVDPTADSIHVGNLAAYMLLKHFLKDGHRVILLMGGGTGMIGDPKPDVERPLLEEAVIDERVQKIKKQVSALFEGNEFEVINNADWLRSLKLIEFLRDTGKHFTVNSLVKKEAIATRFQSEEGISFTEFSYPLLQAFDFWHLFKNKHCDVQIGGSDQWGNIVAGVDLIRRKENQTAYALTLPLITEKATGKKFGKSEGNAVWLDPEKTTPFQFYQFWFNTDDSNVEDYLKIFTMLTMQEIISVLQEHTKDPGSRVAQKRLAFEVTILVHGTRAAEGAENVSRTLFGVAGALSSDDMETLTKEAPSFDATVGENLVELIVRSKLATSKREAREFLSQSAISLNGRIIVDPEYALNTRDITNGFALLKRGKRNVAILLAR